MNGLLGALLGGGVLAGFVAPFTRMAKEVLGIPLLEILLFCCVLHLLFALNALCFMPLEACQQMMLHASINVISIGYAYSSFMVVPSRNAATVREGSSTICLVLLALCIENSSLTGYNWFGLVGSTLGLIIVVVPDLLDLDKSTQLYDTFGYVPACLGGMALTLGLVVFRTLDFLAKLVTVAFLFNMVGSLVCSLAIFLLQQPVMSLDPLTWTCMVAISFRALVSFVCTSYAIIKAHPALVCVVLHSEVVMTLAIQYYVLHETVAPFDILGVGIILGSIAIITAQNISCDPAEDAEATVIQLKGST